MIKSIQKKIYLLLLFFVFVISACSSDGSVSDNSIIDGSIAASPETIEPGQSTTLSWNLGSNSGEADSALIEPGIGTVPIEGSTRVSPEDTTTYTITWTGADSTAEDSVTVTVLAPLTVSISSDKTAIEPGDTATLTWNSANAAGCSIDQGIGSVSLNGSQSVSPSQTTTYTITAQGQLSSVTNSVTIEVFNPPTVTLDVDPASVKQGDPVELSWSSENAISCSIEPGIGAVELNGSRTVIPDETTTYIITAIGGASSITAQQTITVRAKPGVCFSISDSEINHGESITLSWDVQNADSIYINNGIGKVDSSGSRTLTPDYTTMYYMTASSSEGTVNADIAVKVLGNPPEQLPEGSFGEKYQDIVPADASLEKYDKKRFIILTGLVNDISGNPLSGVKVEVFNHPEYGSASTDSEGRFSIPAEGGGVLKLIYTKDGYLTSHRQKETPWNDIVIIEDIALITIDPVATEVVFDGNSETITTHKSTEIIDAEFGNRSCTMVFTGDNMAYEVDKNGNKIRPLSTITTRATEYTTPESMPSVLPPNSAFTHCAELGVDGVERVQFDKPVIMYVDNFLNFPSGGIVPVGYYDRDKGKWIASENGTVVELLDIDSDGVVDALDSDGDGAPNDLDNDGDFCDEVTGLQDSDIYIPGTTYWRVAVKHFTPWDCNWPFGPPEDAEYPNPDGPPETDSDDPVCFAKGTLIHTSGGLIPIEKLIVGDRVWSYDENTGTTVINKVSRIYATPNQQILELKFESEEGKSEIFRVTAEHPFMVVDRGWIPVSELNPEDIISSINDKVMIFKSLNNLIETQTVYNIEVEKQHSYFVGENGLLVHNACTGNVDPKKRVLHQDIPIAGTGMTLHYASNRTAAGFKQKITIPASGSSVPGSLRSITVKVEIAGRSYKRTLSASPNQKAEFILDGKDFLNRYIGGKVNAAVSIGFKYRAVYRKPWSSLSTGSGGSGGAAFGQSGMGSITGDRARKECTLWRHFNVPVYIHANSDANIHIKNKIAEGWTLSSQHYAAGALYKGDGTINQNRMNIITTVAGIGGSRGFQGPFGEGGPATEVRLMPYDVEVDKQGNLIIAETGDNCIRKVDTNGVITTMLGTNEMGTTAFFPSGVALDRNDNLIFSNDSRGSSLDDRMHMMDINGIISIVAGRTTRRPDGDYNNEGMPATEVELEWLTDVVTDGHGNLFFPGTISLGSVRGSRIFKVDTNGIITFVAGTGVDGYSGDGGPAIEAQLDSVRSLAFDLEGNLFIADTYNHCIRKVDTSGIISTVAGTGVKGYSGDGGPAIQAKLYQPQGIVLDPAGNLFIADSVNNRIRMVATNGVITTVAGTGASRYSGDGGPATQATLSHPSGIDIDSKGNLFIVDWRNYCVRKVGSPTMISSVMSSGDISFSDENGLAYIMTSAGQHKKTINLETGKTLLEFSYDGNNLQYITDQFGKQVEIKYQDGNPVEIISPYGLKTSLTIEDNHLRKVSYPDDSFYEFGYINEGLMQYAIDPEQNRCDYVYNDIGRLTDVYNSEEGHWNYTRNSGGDGNVQRVITTGEGNQTTSIDHTYSTGKYTSISTKSSGNVSESETSSDGLNTTISELCGMDITFKYGLDSEYFYKYLKETTFTSKSGLTQTSSTDKTYEDTNNDDIPDLITKTGTANGKTTTLVQNLLTSTNTVSSSEGRTVTSVYNADTLQTESVSVTGLNAVTYEYYHAGHIHYGKLHYVRTGDRETTYTYYDNGNLHTITDPELKVTTYEEYDLMNRVKRVKKPDNTTVQFEYDNNGNMTALITPSGERHEFGYNGDDQKDSYTTPHPRNYSYQYDKDKRLVRKLFPSGKEIIYDYNDGAGDKSLLRQIVTPEGQIDYTYACGSKVETVTKGSESLTWSYDSSLVTSETLSGTLNQTLTYNYDNDGDFLIDGMTYAGGTESFDYDNDNLLTRSGSYTINHKPENGLPDSITGGALSLGRSFNGYGETGGETFTVNGVTVASWNVSTRDNSGRIIEKTETINGTTDTYVYSYDDNGRLATVTKNSSLVEDYIYSNLPYGTCDYRMNSLRGIAGEELNYDDEDRLLNAGSTTYIFNEDGHLASKVKGIEETQYTYSSRGELLNVTLQDSTFIEYEHDPLGRRIAKIINGTIVEKYLWQGLTNLLAVYDGSDTLLMRFQYADGRMPVAMTKGGATYYLGYDQTGTLKAVADSTGNVVKAITYDSFGFIISDSDETFKVPFGFAGGLHDRDTGLVRFGYRDYDPEVGRWTAKDPILFAGGDTDLYGYVLNDPVNFIDMKGLAPGDYHTFEFTAAHAAISEINPTSISTDREYAGYIYPMDGGYSYTAPEKLGTAGGNLPNPGDTKPSAYYHTHGAWGPEFVEPGRDGNETFSPEDKAAADKKNWNAYLGTPFGKFLYYEHDSSSDGKKLGTVPIRKSRGRVPTQNCN